MNFIRLLAVSLCFLAFGIAEISAQTEQTGTSSEPAATAASAELAEAIRLAGENGVDVIVIDTAGNIVNRQSGTGNTDAEPSETGMERASGLMQAQADIQQFRSTFSERIEALPNSLDRVGEMLRAKSPDGTIWAFVRIFLICGAMLIIGRIAATEIYGKRMVRKFVTGRVKENPQGYLEKMPFLAFRFVMGIGGTIFSMVVAYALGTLIFGMTDNITIQFTITAIFIAWFVGRTLSDIWRMILSPFLSQYRLTHFSDSDAKKLYYWASTLAGVNVFVILLSTWIHDFGVDYNVYAALSGVLASIAFVLNLAMILANRRAITNAILVGKPTSQVSWLKKVIAYGWAPVLILYLIFGWCRLIFDLVMNRPEATPLVIGAYIVFLAMMIVYGAINYLIERYFDRRITVDRMNSELAASDASEDSVGPMSFTGPTITTYEALARRVAGILAFVAGLYALLRLWDPDNAVLQESFIKNLLDVITIIFIGYIVYNFLRIWLDSKIAEETYDTPADAEVGDEGGDSATTRLGTLLPLFRGAILAVIVVTIVLIALLEIGVNVSPLFAGAGVVGLAVGFGAQTLVRDIFSGAFFLIDDAFRKGEYIDIESVKGTVEKISVRSFQLRHHKGALHTIPFGEIRVLTNYSRDWVIMKLPLRVTYDTDVEKVRKLIKKLGQDLLEDPVIGPTFLQPLKSQGVIEMQDSAMIIRTKFMSKPGDQWLIRKRVYEEIRILFAREGIKFANREVTVRLADGHVDDLTDEQREAIAGAARAAVDDGELDDMKGVGDDR
ncbi:mechanosensitive ion channel [Sulfitobacter sp. BDSS02]|nr:mechanosensitive ion channel [Sulfitobacter sp. BDSS02]MBR9850196.1 mechanosensitive ion channel [Paracoccaceae bacterium]